MSDPFAATATPSSTTTWETVFLYTQLYVAPLLLLGCLTAMTVYRREMSSNRVYLREEDTRWQHPPTQQHQQQQTATTTTTATSNATTTVGTSAFLKSYIVSLAPLLWCQTVVASHPATTRVPATDTSTIATTTQQPEEYSLSSLFRVVVPDLLSLTWTDDSTEAIKTVATSVAQLARLDVSEESSSWSSIFLRHGRRPAESKPKTNPDELPPDIQVQIMSFLHPEDVVTFAGTNNACRDIVEGNGPVTRALWKCLFERDYAWVIHSWDIGRQAFQRSNVRNTSIVYDKEFYFRFGLGYLNYVLAGQNTHERCLIGIHGNIYDITHFITNHPGSPDTLLVHAGRDASRFFDDMDHSKGARQLAKDLCVVVDKSYEGSYGLKPTSQFPADGPTPEPVPADPVCSKKEKRGRYRGTLENIYKDFAVEEYRHRRAFKSRLRNNRKVLHSNVYYDPFQRKWTGWYTSTEFETIFLPNEGWDFSKSQSFDDGSPATSQEEEEENQSRPFC